MSDDRIESLRREARANPGDFNAWDAFSRACVRAGVDGSESFDPMHKLLRARAFEAEAAYWDTRRDVEVYARHLSEGDYTLAEARLQADCESPPSGHASAESEEAACAAYRLSFYTRAISAGPGAFVRWYSSEEFPVTQSGYVKRQTVNGSNLGPQYGSLWEIVDAKGDYVAHVYDAEISVENAWDRLHGVNIPWKALSLDPSAAIC